MNIKTENSGNLHIFNIDLSHTQRKNSILSSSNFNNIRESVVNMTNEDPAIHLFTSQMM